MSLQSIVSRTFRTTKKTVITAMFLASMYFPMTASAQTATSTPSGAPPPTQFDLPIVPDYSHAPGYTFERPDPEFPEEDDPPQLYDEDLPTESDSIIYVLDISGSMDWGTSSYTGLDGNPATGSKLDRAKVELQRSINALTPDFDFNIIAYDCSMRRWKGNTVEANDQNKAQASGWVGGLRAGGATGTGPAGALALSDKTNYTVVILSDGAPNCGANGHSGHLGMILSANTQGGNVHTFGIAASGSFETFLRNIANQTGGRYFPIP